VLWAKRVNKSNEKCSYCDNMFLERFSKYHRSSFSVLVKLIHLSNYLFVLFSLCDHLW